MLKKTNQPQGGKIQPQGEKKEIPVNETSS